MEKSNLKELLEEIDNRIETLKKQQELADAVERLHNNDDFIKVIIDGYFGDEAKRLCGLLLEPNGLKREIILNINDKLTAIRNFKIFIGTVLQNASIAQEQIDEEMKYRKEVTSSSKDGNSNE
jgi:hypothetical protein